MLKTRNLYQKNQPKIQIIIDAGNEAWKQNSTEFCGGTHIGNTGEAEAFVVLCEEGIAKGVRRITGLTNPKP